MGVEFRTWVRRIPKIDSEVLGTDGTPLPFDRARITPYALRHSYAQRHADAGVPVDVLRELLDHVSVQTTMGYYSVSLKRKRQAIATVGSLAFDAERERGALHRPARLRARLGVGALRQLHRAGQRESRGRALPDPLPVRWVFLLPAGSPPTFRHSRSTSPRCVPTGRARLR